MNGLDIAFSETKCVNIRIDLTRDIPLTIIDKFPQLVKKDRRMNLREIIYAEDFPPLADEFDEIVSGRQKTLSAHCRIHIHDDYHWVYLSCKSGKDAFNRTQHLTGTMMDVSEYLETADADSVLGGVARKGRERITAALNNHDISLAAVLGQDYLISIQKAFAAINGVSSAIYNPDGSLVLSTADENGNVISQRRFKHKISREIRCNHRLMAVWTIASNDEELLAASESLLDVLAQTVSQTANALLMLNSVMENSQTANQQLGSNIEQQILLNNIYTILLEENDSDGALDTVIRFVGEYLKLDRIALYSYNKSNEKAYLTKEWSEEGIDIQYRFKVSDFPKIIEELDYCDTFFYNSTRDNNKLNRTGVKSVAAAQLSQNGEFRGIIFFEAVRENRDWSNADKKLLRNISQIISTMLIRCGMDEELKQQNEQLKKLAYTDPVLDIPNRRRLDRDLKSELKKGNSGAAVTVKFVNTGTANEAFEHIHSDSLLKSVSQYIENSDAKDACVYRFSGSVLMVLLKGADIVTVKEFVNDLIARFTKSWLIGEEECYMDMNAGAAFYPSDGAGCDDVYRASTLAMQRAVREGKNRLAFYTKEFAENTGAIFSAENRLRFAVQNGMEGFSIKYMPITALDGSVTALEAVVRWNDGKSGELPPGQLIRLAESIGLDETIDAWVIDNSCAFLRELIDLSGNKKLIMNINLTFHELRYSKVYETVQVALDKYSLGGSNLAVEIPERAQLITYGETAGVLNHLRDLGLSLVIDDFGREYMSLTALKKGSVSNIKIRAVQFCEADEFDRAALKGLLLLAHSRGTTVCVKHIEQAIQLETVKAYNIDLLQGDHILPTADKNGIRAIFSAAK